MFKVLFADYGVLALFNRVSNTSFFMLIFHFLSQSDLIEIVGIVLQAILQHHAENYRIY